MGNELNAKSIYSVLMQTYYIPESYERWTDYRKRVTDYIIKYTESGKTLAIVGVGDSNDIDLARLYEHVGSLALYDINLESMNRALEKYGLTDKPSITVDSCDLFGATKEDYLELIDIVLKDFKRLKKGGMAWSPYCSSEKYIGKISEIFNRINDRDIFITDRKYDYTIILGVHSQVLGFVENIWNHFLLAVGKSDKLVHNKVHEENEILMPKINDAILKMTKESAFIGGEVFENNPQCLVDGARQGLRDIQERCQRGELKSDSSYCDLWPHRDGVEYQMVINLVYK